jgi:hypothetical protein
MDKGVERSDFSLILSDRPETVLEYPRKTRKYDNFLLNQRFGSINTILLRSFTTGINKETRMESAEGRNMYICMVDKFMSCTVHLLAITVVCWQAGS